MSRRFAGIAVPLLLLAGCEQPPPEEEIVRPVRAMRIEDASAFKGRIFPGRAEAHSEVNLSFRVGGPLITRPVKVGDKVKQGDVLARIDPRDYEVELRKVEARLATARAERAAMEQARPEDVRRATAKVDKARSAVRLATRDLDRLLRIQKQDAGAVSQAGIDRAQDKKKETDAELRNAEEELRIANIGARKEDIAAKDAEIMSLEAAVDAAKDALSYTYLKAPFGGTVVATYVENFEYVQSRQAIMRMLDTDRIEMVVNIPENLISLAGKVTNVRVRYDAFPGRWIPAEIWEVGKEASETTRTFPVTVIHDQPEGIRILPGMAGESTADVQSKAQAEEPRVVVPVTAVLTDLESQKSFVWVIDETASTVSKREVKTGRLTDYGIPVEQGLNVGQWIATAGVDYLREGQKVKIMATGAGAAGQGS